MAKTRSGTSRPVKSATRGSAPLRFRPFRRTLPILLLLAREVVIKRFRPSIHARGFTVQQWRVVRALAEVESLDIVELSASCCVHPASLSRILPKLGADGIIARAADSSDQRCVIVSLTPHGRSVFESIVLPVSEALYQELARDVGSERLEQIYQMLEQLIGLLAERKPAARVKRPPRAP